jgi:hypothetical protein
MVAAQEELARRTRANAGDLVAFFSAKQRADEVDEWLQDRVKALHAQAEKRRAEEHQRCGAALRAIRARGESLVEITRITGIQQRAVRDLIKLAEQSPAAPDEKSPAGGIATRELHQHRVATEADGRTRTAVGADSTAVNEATESIAETSAI